MSVRAISLFSGAGGLDLGAHNAGASVVACIEKDSDSVQTLRSNRQFANCSIFEQDICEFDFRELKEHTPGRSGDKLIVIGGPPCQPFSKNGYWIKNKNRKVERDPRNLISNYLDCVEELKPDGFLLENVESIFHPTNKHVIQYISDRAESYGYAVQIVRANAADYGVPQKRKRVFILGFRSGKVPGEPPARTHGDPGKRDLFEDLPPYEGVGKFIAPFKSDKFFEPQEVASEGNYYFELTNVPPGKNYIELSKLNGYGGRAFKPGSRFWNFLLKLHPNLPSWTIAAQPGPWVGPFHWDNRRLRAVESAAIQTFPTGYKFAGNRRSVQMQIGNAVPVKLGEVMVRHLINHLE